MITNILLKYEAKAPSQLEHYITISLYNAAPVSCLVYTVFWREEPVYYIDVIVHPHLVGLLEIPATGMWTS